jgi:hypothetical protein
VFTCVNDTSDNFIAGVVDTSEQLVAGVVDTSEKRSAGVVDTGNISANFRKNRICLTGILRGPGETNS